MSYLEGDTAGRNPQEAPPPLSRLDQDLAGLPVGLATYIRDVEYPQQIGTVVTKWRAAVQERPTNNLAETLSRWAGLKLKPAEVDTISAQRKDAELYTFFAERSLDRSRPWNNTVRNIALNTAYRLHHLGSLPAFHEFYLLNKDTLSDATQGSEVVEHIKQYTAASKIHEDDAQRLLTTTSKANNEKSEQRRNESLSNVKLSLLQALFEREQYTIGLEFLGQHTLPTDEHYAALAKPPGIDFVRGLELQKVSHMLTQGIANPFRVVRQVPQFDEGVFGLELEGEYQPTSLFPAYSMKHGSITPHELLRTDSSSDVYGEFVRIAQLREQGVLPKIGFTGSYIVREHDAKEGGTIKNPDSTYIELVFPPNPNKPYKQPEQMYTRVIGGPEEPFSQRSILTGMCLFNGYSATLTGESGELQTITNYHLPIKERTVPGSLRVPEKTTVYEDEALLRLPYTIEALSRGMPIDAVNVAIPGAEYYHYILDAFQNGLVDRDDVLTWFDAVDKRQSDLESLMDVFLAKRLGSRIQNILFREVRPLEVLKPYIRYSVQRGRVPDMREELALLRENLKENKDYRDIFEVLLGVNQPRTYLDLNFMSYSAMQLRACGKDRLVYSVMDPKESTMQTRTEAMYKEAAQRADLSFELIGIYPLEEVVAERGSNSLYHLPLFTSQAQKDPFLYNLVCRYDE